MFDWWSILVIIMSVLVIAATSIGIGAINKCEPGDAPRSKQYLIFMLTGAILALLGTGYMIYKNK